MSRRVPTACCLRRGTLRFQAAERGLPGRSPSDTLAAGQHLTVLPRATPGPVNATHRVHVAVPGGRRFTVWTHPAPTTTATAVGPERQCPLPLPFHRSAVPPEAMEHTGMRVEAPPDACWQDANDALTLRLNNPDNVRLVVMVRWSVATRGEANILPADTTSPAPIEGYGLGRGFRIWSVEPGGAALIVRPASTLLYFDVIGVSEAQP